MIDLKHAVQEQGFTVAHIKTDSIKIPDATPELIEFVSNFGAKYGYDFEHEATYEKFVLVNDAVYVARKDNEFHAVGAQFQHPYVYKKLFTGEEITYDDLCETKQVTQGLMYLDFGSHVKHIGRIGRFVPVTQEAGGGTLLRIKDEKRYAVTGTKGRFWLEADVAQQAYADGQVDMTYFEELAEDGFKTIDYFGSFADFAGSK